MILLRTKQVWHLHFTSIANKFHRLLGQAIDLKVDKLLVAPCFSWIECEWNVDRFTTRNHFCLKAVMQLWSGFILTLHTESKDLTLYLHAICTYMQVASNPVTATFISFLAVE